MLATQNPIEQEGTYPLPEAQQDRFMFKVFVDYPNFDEEFEVARRTTTGTDVEIEQVLNAEEIVSLQQMVREVPVSEHVIRFTLSLVRQTRVGSAGTPDFIDEHRAGDGVTHDIAPRTPHDAVVEPDASGKSVNQLQVRVGEDKTDFLVNGTVVYTLGSIIQARLNMPEMPGMRSSTEGIWGVRVNHRIPGVLVEALRVR